MRDPLIRAADEGQKAITATLDERYGYILVVRDFATDDIAWNTNITVKREFAKYLRTWADDLERNGPPPERPLDG
jgi:hypothetical protein